MGDSVRRGLSVLTVCAVVVSLAGAAPAQATTTATTPAWRVAAMPPLGLPSRLVDVAATGPGNAWAVGHQEPGSGTPVSPPPYALLHWNGDRWCERLLPDDIGALSAVSAASASNVWTVGRDLQFSPYAAHWNGKRWQGYRPLGQDHQPGLFDVSTRGRRAVFVGGDGGPLVVEWDGRRFARATVPGADAWFGGLYGVATAPGGAAFAVGEWYVGDGPHAEPLIVQRTGSRWRIAPLPAIPAAQLRGVWARSANDVWAVGTVDYDSAPKPLILHWDGARWLRVPAPIDTGGLTAVAGDAAGNLWVSVADQAPADIQHPGSLFLRYAGGRWSTAYGPRVENADPHLSALTNIPGTSAFWSVGWVSHPAADSTPLIERTSTRR